MESYILVYLVFVVLIRQILKMGRTLKTLQELWMMSKSTSVPKLGVGVKACQRNFCNTNILKGTIPETPPWVRGWVSDEATCKADSVGTAEITCSCRELFQCWCTETVGKQETLSKSTYYVLSYLDLRGQLLAIWVYIQVSEFLWQSSTNPSNHL